jgi:hypothetical protein
MNVTIDFPSGQIVIKRNIIKVTHGRMLSSIEFNKIEFSIVKGKISVDDGSILIDLNGGITSMEIKAECAATPSTDVAATPSTGVAYVVTRNSVYEIFLTDQELKVTKRAGSDESKIKVGETYNNLTEVSISENAMIGVEKDRGIRLITSPSKVVFFSIRIN